MAVYVIGVVTVTDPSWVEDYVPKVDALVRAHGGRYLARAQAPERLEGDLDVPSVAVILEFPDEASARGWYSSGDYAPFLKARPAGSEGTLFLMPGV